MTKSGITICVVDDDPSVCKALSRLIKSDGFRVKTYGSAQEFLDDDHSMGSDLLVLDVRMPGMNGLNLQNHLAASGHTIPIVFITAYENGKDAYDAFVVLKDKIDNKGESITDLVNLAVFDIEMPQMDGLTLCKNVKTDIGLPNIPVIMFSSLINKQMEIKCKKMGADAHITKPQINELVELVDKFCFNEE